MRMYNGCMQGLTIFRITGYRLPYIGVPFPGIPFLGLGIPKEFREFPDFQEFLRDSGFHIPDVFLNATKYALRIKQRGMII